MLSIAQIKTMIFARTWFLLILLPGIAAAQELKILLQPKEVKATREAFPADTKVRIFIRDPKNSESEIIVRSLQEDVKLALDASWKVEDLKQWNSKSRSVVLGLLEGNADVTRILKARKVVVPMAVSRELVYLSSWSTDLRYEPGSGNRQEAQRFIAAAKTVLAWAKGSM